MIRYAMLARHALQFCSRTAPISTRAQASPATPRRTAHAAHMRTSQHLKCPCRQGPLLAAARTATATAAAAAAAVAVGVQCLCHEWRHEALAAHAARVVWALFARCTCNRRHSQGM